jgi:O-antigen/teichoic acid export membrane protein
MKHLFNFTLKILCFTLLIAGIFFLLQETWKPDWVHQKLWLILSFFALLTWLTGIFSMYLLSLSKENSPNIILGTTVIRFLASAGFIAILLVLGVENIILFVVNFFVIYFLYLLFDIYGVMANLRPNSK